MIRTRTSSAPGSVERCALCRWAPALLTCTALAVNSSAQNCTPVRLSVDANGIEGDGPSTQPAITPDGRYVVFVSAATNLVPGDTNGVADVFVHDVATGLLERVSLGAGGVECDQACSYPAISADGRYVVFNTGSTTLVAGDTNNSLDVYVRDRVNGTNELVSSNAAGTPGNAASFGAAVSSDGRYVTFVSWADNLVPGDTNATRDVFLRDRQLGTIERVSVGTGGVEGDDMGGSGSLLSFVTPDGRHVLFGSMASTLVAGDANGAMDAFVRDRVTGTTSLLVQAPGGGAPTNGADLASMTSDGRWVGFASAAPDLVPNDTNGTADAFVLDRSNGTIERVSLTDAGLESTGESWGPFVSLGGRFAVFSSASTDLVANDVNGRRDVFRRDRWAGTTERSVPGSSAAQPQADVYAASITAAAEFAAVAYAGDDFAFGDTNLVSDVFLAGCTNSVSYCSGDGTAAACPCGGVGAWRSGCPNSFGTSAYIGDSGRALTSADTLGLHVRNVPRNTTVQFFQSTSQQSGGNGTPTGDGLRCLSSPLVRLGTLYAPDGTASWGFGTPGSPPLSVQGAVPSGGDYRYYQAYYRNPPAYCTQSTFNTSNALEILWLP